MRGGRTANLGRLMLLKQLLHRQLCLEAGLLLWGLSLLWCSFFFSSLVG